MAYSTTTEYADRDKYLAFSGIDLDTEFKRGNTDNPTLAVAIFIKNVTRQMYMKISHDFNISEWDDDTFSEALLWQIKHVLRYGEDGKLDETAYSIMHDSGMINPANQPRYYGPVY